MMMNSTSLVVSASFSPSKYSPYTLHATSVYSVNQLNFSYSPSSQSFDIVGSASNLTNSYSYDYVYVPLGASASTFSNAGSITVTNVSLSYDVYFWLDNSYTKISANTPFSEVYTISSNNLQYFCGYAPTTSSTVNSVTSLYIPMRVPHSFVTSNISPLTNIVDTEFSATMSFSQGIDSSTVVLNIPFTLNTPFSLTIGDYLTSTKINYSSSFESVPNIFFYVIDQYSNTYNIGSGPIYNNAVSSYEFFSRNTGTISRGFFLLQFEVPIGVSSFNITIPARATNNFAIYSVDTEYNALRNLFDILSNGIPGATDATNSAIDNLGSEFQQYEQDTDTSVQYGNISDDLFSLDTNIWIQMASTITLFSSNVTAVWSALGDFSSALTVFLIIVFISSILGIMRYASSIGSSDHGPPSDDERWLY